VFILNVLAFMLIGMQLRPIWSRLDDVVRLHCGRCSWRWS